MIHETAEIEISLETTPSTQQIQIKNMKTNEMIHSTRAGVPARRFRLKHTQGDFHDTWVWAGYSSDDLSELRAFAKAHTAEFLAAGRDGRTRWTIEDNATVDESGPGNMLHAI